jgi:soluble lytic murein transglycosylase
LNPSTSLVKLYQREMAHRTGIFLLALTLAAFPRPVFPQSADQGELFAQAYALYSAGDLTSAKALFQKTLESNFRLADYSLYYLAAIAFTETNMDQARQLVAQLKRRFPQSIWLPAVALLRAKADIADKDYVSAIDALRQLRSDKSAKREIVEEALCLHAQSLEAQGDPGRAYALYDELRNTSPNSRWTAAARKSQGRLRDKFPEVFPFQTLESLADEADRLTREQQSSEAEILYKKLLNNVSEPDLRLRYLTRLADVYLAIRNRNEAIPLLEQIAREFPDSAEAPKAIYQIGQILWNRHDNTKALEQFKILIEKYPTSAYVERARYASADIHEYFGRREEAIQLYSGIQKQIPKSQVRDDAAWRLAWLYYRAGELESALATFRELVAQTKDGPFVTAGLYWQGRVAERLSESETAKQLYRQIVNGAEESYYQALALRGLERLGSPVEDTKSTKLSAVIESDPPLAPELTFHLSRARNLTALSLHQLAVAELDEVNRRSKPNGRVRALLMREYFHSQAYGRSLILANQLPISQAERDLYRYPLAYWQLIQKKAQERGLDPYLVLALIRQESLFDTHARSPATALGLMQLIPPTAARVARQLGLPAPSNETLFKPEVNVGLGTQYLKDLLQRYSNNWFKALAAYNAGEAAVDRWEKEIATDDTEEFVERIPYIETRGYVKLVLRNHRIYKRLYESQK